MSDIYSTLQLSPKKRRQPSPDESNFTPKKLRTTPLTPSSISHRKETSGTSVPTNKLPDHLARLCAIHNSLQRAISHALATCAVSPTSDSGQLRNVVNHISLKTYSGLSSSFEANDLKRLCWLWEWDGLRYYDVEKGKEKEENPFLDEPPVSDDWTRGAMGFLVTSTTHLSKQARQRVPAYGVGIEIEIDIDKGMDSGMAAVARWTSETDSRQRAFKRKVERWNELHKGDEFIPAIPLADLPTLLSSIKASSLTMKLASASPKGTSSKTMLYPPASPVHSPKKSPTKKGASQFTVPFPSLMSTASPNKKSSLLFPQTPRHKRIETFAAPVTPQTPSNKASTDLRDVETPPETPIKQTGSLAETAPATPSTSKRQALYERIRQKSLTASPTKSIQGPRTPNSSLTRDQMLKLSQEETRRRCLLGRLDRVAESVWMKFSAPVTGSLTTSGRKRRALPASEVAAAVVQSSHVPVSAAEANESLVLLMKLCPFFLKRLDIQGEEWLEMPASSPNPLGNSSGTSSASTTPTKRGLVPPPSPGSKIDSAELIHRSPKRVKKEAGGLREVREIIRKELELQD
ncbi:hypothetical protein D9756_000525 [Leucocoprinus leucothites]|uniref:DNA replication factor Cdt1 C-terminal domain-containing protein n=1 Tax=Leucocoprinus leucothites TaxID=201217 RepID=A0A8H5GEE0_9AGAR|nr:hypothetical protein D9756_000525 [Leucoagaricus leucothites]